MLCTVRDCSITTVYDGRWDVAVFVSAIWRDERGQVYQCTPMSSAIALSDDLASDYARIWYHFAGGDGHRPPNHDLVA